MTNDKQEPGPHLDPKAERIEALVAILVIGDDVPEILNEDATELRIYNGPSRQRRSYVWDESATPPRWKRKEVDNR